MTASTTPALGLMSPVGTDPFQTSDFTNTFTVLDQNPGVLSVANQASRPTGWTSTKHGRFVWQTDQQVMWMWNQPTTSPPGSWVRPFPKGAIATVTNPATVTASTSVPTSGPTLVAANAIVIPGGRSLRITFFWDNANSDNGLLGVSFWDDGVLQYNSNMNGFSSNTPNTYPRAQAGTMTLIRNPAPTTQVTKSYKWTMYQTAGGSGASVTNTGMIIEEI